MGREGWCHKGVAAPGPSVNIWIESWLPWAAARFWQGRDRVGYLLTRLTAFGGWISTALAVLRPGAFPCCRP
jgi:hypothetical protein